MPPPPAAANMFAALGGKGDANAAKAKQAKEAEKKAAAAAVAAANAAAVAAAREAEASSGNRRKAKPAVAAGEPQQQPGPDHVPRGFKVVEVKANRRDANKPRAPREEAPAPSDFGSVWGAAAAAPVKAPKPKQSAYAPKGGPVGGIVIDEEAAKAEARAIQKLRKQQATQRYVPRRGDALGEVAGRGAADDDADANESAAGRGAAARGGPSVTVHPAAKGWKAMPAPAQDAGPGDLGEDSMFVFRPAKKPAAGKGTKARHADPLAAVDAPHVIPGLSNSADNDLVTLPAKQRGNAKPSGGKNAGKNNNAAGSESGAKATVPAPRAAPTIDHTHLADGSVVARVAFVFEFPSEKSPYKPTEDCDRLCAKEDLSKASAAALAAPETSADGKAFVARIARQVADRIQRSAPLRGGFYIGAESKSFSNFATIDEPWMAETYLKALLPLLKRERAVTTARPFWPATTGARRTGGDGAAEAEVTLRLLDCGTALELEHTDRHCAARVNAHTLRVSFRSFVDTICAQASIVAAVAAACETLVPASMLQRDLAMSRLPRHLGTLVPAVREAADAYFAALAATSQ